MLFFSFVLKQRVPQDDLCRELCRERRILVKHKLNVLVQFPSNRFFTCYFNQFLNEFYQTLAVTFPSFSHTEKPRQGWEFIHALFYKGNKQDEETGKPPLQTLTFYQPAQGLWCRSLAVKRELLGWKLLIQKQTPSFFFISLYSM